MKYTVKETSPGVFRLSEIVQDSQARTGFDGAPERMEFSPLAKVTRIRARKRIGDFTLDQIQQSAELPDMAEIAPALQPGMPEGTIVFFNEQLFKIAPGHTAGEADDPEADTDNYIRL